MPFSNKERLYRRREFLGAAVGGLIATAPFLKFLLEGELLVVEAKASEALQKLPQAPQIPKEVIRPLEKIISVLPEIQEIVPVPHQETKVGAPQQEKTAAPQEKQAAPKTGIELLEKLGLKGKIVYILYGRPKKYGEQTWGSLGATQTAEQSWQFFQNQKKAIAAATGKDLERDFALNILNPVYRAPNGEIEDVYVQKALELAAENQGLVALNFNSFTDAQNTIQRLESILPKEFLPFLAVGLDVEHFLPNGKTDADSLNKFSTWFAKKHKEWSGDSQVPGLVIVYTFYGPSGKGTIANLDKLNQYYLPEETLVVAQFDGFGTTEEKRNQMARLVRGLPDSPEFPALVGGMEFYSLWKFRYDKDSSDKTFNILKGAPTFFLASQ